MNNQSPQCSLLLDLTKTSFTLYSCSDDNEIMLDFEPYIRINLSKRDARHISDVLAISSFGEGVITLLGRKKVLELENESLKAKLKRLKRTLKAFSKGRNYDSQKFN